MSGFGRLPPFLAGFDQPSDIERDDCDENCDEIESTTNKGSESPANQDQEDFQC